MTGRTSPANLEELLERIGDAGDDPQKVRMKDVLEAVGRSSFGPLVLLAGVITLTPLIGDIPGVPTTMGVLVLLTAGQMLIGRSYFWFPRWVLRRSIDRAKLRKGAKWLRRPARFVDRILRVRLSSLSEGAGAYGVAAACFIVAAGMPALDFIPFSANLAGLLLTTFGLSLIARDGLFALVGFLLLAGLIVMVALKVL